jgi:hypothetical protein
MSDRVCEGAEYPRGMTESDGQKRSEVHGALRSGTKVLACAQN